MEVQKEKEDRLRDELKELRGQLELFEEETI